jgi:glycine betaine/proline transport system ATP-binding protein
MQDEFLRIQSTLKKSIVFITHDFLEALRIADRMMIMRDGMVVQIGTPAELIINPADDYVAEFTSDVPLARVLLAREAMDDTVQSKAGMHCVQGTDCVEDILPSLATHRQGVAIIDGGETIGVVTPTSVVCALSRGQANDKNAVWSEEAAK